MEESYYDILNCNENATYEELKTSYQKLVREHHPDKCERPTIDTYHQIDEAWKTLKDSNLRKEYNAKLINDRLSSQVMKYASLNTNELDYNSEEDIYTYNCRCGGVYILNSDNIKEDCTVSCNECSFYIDINVNK